MAAIQFTPEARKQVVQLNGRVIARMQNVVDRLTKWPEVSGAKPLRGNLKGNYRMRIGGEWRMLFRLEGDTIVVWKISNRRDVYEV